MPVFIGVQWPTREAAQSCPRGDLALVFCGQCGFIWNHRFDPARMQYTQRYDNSLDFSPAFQEFARQLAVRLIETYGIRDKDVIELGCGKGHFLTLLCELGNNRGTGFDPSYEGARMQSACPDRITYIQDIYCEQYTHHRGDLICCRHVFEHIPNPAPVLSMVRRTIGDRHEAITYFEVPNVRFILEKLSIWDIIYEHCSYFSQESLSYVFRKCGFQILREQAAYAAQFLSVEARLADDATSNTAPEDLAELTGMVHQFSEQVRNRTSLWRLRLDRIEQEGKRVALWGGGAKAVSFLNMLKVTDSIPVVVDINPHKQGMYLPGTGQKIVGPEFLKEFQPNEIILMNPIYRREIEEQLRQLGVAAKIVEA
jgi:2-polyprenyl-3-methyl-5-hydroxy-6-metoxy-1,4-benzoquinol methylase